VAEKISSANTAIGALPGNGYDCNSTETRLQFDRRATAVRLRGVSRNFQWGQDRKADKRGQRPRAG